MICHKVRKAATRCVSAIVKTRPEKLGHLYEVMAPVLVKRFKEREESVKLDVMSTITDILQQTLNVVSAEGDSKHGHSTVKKLTSLVPDIIKGLAKELTGKSVKTKIGAFHLLSEITTVIPGALDEDFGLFVPGITSALADKSTPLRIEALSFLKSCMSHKSAAVVYTKHIDLLLTPVIKAASDNFYKIIAEALRVICQVIKILAAASETEDPSKHVPILYKSIMLNLEKTEVDQEVKESAIEAIGLLISLLGNKLDVDQITAALKILTDRLSNEVTRLSTVQTIDLIASSKHKIDLGNHLTVIMKELSGFLRKKNRQLKQSSLSALTSVVKTHGKSKNAAALYDDVLKEIAPVIGEQDLHLTHLALRLTASILHASSSTADSIASVVLPASHALLKTGFLQGVALESMTKLFKELVASKSKKVTYDSLLKGLISLTTGESSKQSYNAIAQCISVLIASTETGKDDTIKKFVADCVSKKDSDRLLGLYCVGEIGSRVDLTNYSGVKTNIVASFDSNSEDVKSAASVAFGCIACGNLAKFLPEILSEVKANPTRKYLLLGSLREVIVRLSGSKEGKETLTKHFDELLKLLFEHADHGQEGTRNIVSECLGKLALINPEPVITQLKASCKNSSANVRSCVATALKYTIFEKTLPIDKVLKEHISAFFELLSDPALEVRKAILVSLNHVGHHKAKIVRDALPKYLNLLYGETKPKPELIKEIVLGPFKHKVDTGLDTRQAAFEAMYTFLDTCITRLEVTEYISHVANGLTDESFDIQLLNHLILVRLAKKAPTTLVASLDLLVEPLKTCVTSKAKDETVTQQVEHNNELIRSCLRAIYAITQIPDHESSQKFQEFMKTTVQAGDLAKLYQEVVIASSER